MKFYICPLVSLANQSILDCILVLFSVSTVNVHLRVLYLDYPQDPKSDGQ